MTPSLPVAVVTGASRGAGRGIAVALGRHGCTVYVTGRSERSDAGRLPGTIDETADAVTAAGGTGIAVRVDHGVDADVAGLFDRVRQEQGRLDILVNNACALHDQLTAPGNFWEKPLGLVDMLDVGLRSSYVASHHAAPLMIERPGGLMMFTSASGAAHYSFGPAYGAHKAGMDKLAADMAVDLKPFGIAALSIWMGALLTDRLRMVIASDPVKFAGLEARTETPEFTGEAIWALYRDPDLMAQSGRTVIGAEVARAHGLADAGGRHPASCRDTHGVAPHVQHALVLR